MGGIGLVDRKTEGNKTTSPSFLTRTGRQINPVNQLGSTAKTMRVDNHFWEGLLLL